MRKKDISVFQPKIEAIARDCGLDFFPVIFEVVDYDTMNQLAAYGGFPTRYPHWRFGMEYDQLSKGYRYGLQKIYEMVVNTNPCYAYLMECNPLVDQKLVMAHVYAHCDFFKNNCYFSPTNRKMIDEMANHAIRIRRYMNMFGQDEVESFIDICLSLQNLIDPHSVAIKRRGNEAKGTGREGSGVKRLRSKKYMERYINPDEFLKNQRKKLDDLNEKKAPPVKIPERPEKDVLLFLLEHGHLKDWQQSILDIVREEAYYFAPQAMTKIMNEGWATYWHSTIMINKVVKPSELVDYATHHSATIAAYPGRLNPYRIGLMLFKDIEDRWNKGRFGREYEECADLKEKRQWNTHLNLGREKIFEVRKLYNDLTFLDDFLTEEFCREHRLFSFAYNRDEEQYEIESRAFPQIKKRFLQSLTNAGQPIISVVDGNYKNRGELLLHHDFDGVELDLAYAEDTLENLLKLWKRPVHIRTVVEEESGKVNKLLSFSKDGFKIKTVK